MSKFYECPNCGKIAEAMTSKKVKKCKECKIEMVQKIDNKFAPDKQNTQYKQNVSYHRKRTAVDELVDWCPSLGGDRDAADDNSRFLYQGQSIVGVPSKDREFVEMLRAAVMGGYK